MNAERERELVERATTYPYAVPPRSFVQVGERTLDPAELEVDLAGRTPLLAYGANAAPSVLARKLAAAAEPVLARQAAMRDFDVVYSAHISPYGSLPATIQRSPGSEASVFILYLSEGQLDSISRTEPNYELALLDGISCRLDNGDSLTEVTAYLSRHGCLAFDGSEVALKAVQATARRFPAMDESRALAQARDLLAPELSLERFIVGSATEPELAKERTAALRKMARPLSDPPQTVLKRRRAKRATNP